jgi:acetaldehyde dehydrogenase (acetylating)
VARLDGVGRDHPLSIEKLSPVLAFYVVKDWHEASERVFQLLRFGGTGHTMAIHSRDDAVIREFALRKPVFRVIANTQASMGATGYTTGLAPAMSLGCGAYAGNITSDNITPFHLINIKRLAYPVARQAQGAPAAAPAPVAPGPAAPAAPAPPKAAPPPEPVLDFVCEEDVRRALREGRTLRVSRRAIITPSARDEAEGRKVLVVVPE